MPAHDASPPHSLAPRRCAIYTRKSSDEGLDQAFNSLDAQRQSCESYIASQRNEGWRLVPTLYDDGGFSGGNTERPALQRLLADVEQGVVDIIVVYKIDRLTRSLADFARMVEIFDARNVSFVSVTQQFNSTTSMGRLTLNVLLSFAQYEREIAGERISDKIKLSKQRGMWMGGFVPVGYLKHDRSLMIDQLEAETVRLIFSVCKIPIKAAKSAHKRQIRIVLVAAENARRPALGRIPAQSSPLPARFGLQTQSSTLISAPVSPVGLGVRRTRSGRHSYQLRSGRSSHQLGGPGSTGMKSTPVESFFGS